MCQKKTISAGELHANTAKWVRQVVRHGAIVLTDRGRIVAKNYARNDIAGSPYFARRVVSSAFAKLASAGKLRRGTNVTKIISEQREDRAS